MPKLGYLVKSNQVAGNGWSFLLCGMTSFSVTISITCGTQLQLGSVASGTGSPLSSARIICLPAMAPHWCPRRCCFLWQRPRLSVHAKHRADRLIPLFLYQLVLQMVAPHLQNPPEGTQTRAR